MKGLFAALALVFLAASASAQTPAEREAAEQVEAEDATYGQRIDVHFGIASLRIGSNQPDQGGIATYTAPAGFSIIGHEIHYDGFHSGVVHHEAVQPGRLAYESSAYVTLTDTIRKGVIEGRLSIGDKSGVAVGAKEFADFLKRFEAKYKFVADTHGSISFRWWAHTKWASHGSAIRASATITIQKRASEDDARRAAEAILFALEIGERSNVFQLMDSVLGVSRPEQ